MTITQLLFEENGFKIYFASDYLDVILNLRQWNQDVSIDEI